MTGFQNTKILEFHFYEIFFVRFSMGIEDYASGYAPLAQLVEQLTLNQWVPGSNP